MTTLEPGDSVLIQGMVKRQDINGAVGEVLGMDEASGRVIVEVGEEQLKIKPENLELCEEEDDEEEEDEEEEEEESCDEHASLEIQRQGVDDRLGLNFAETGNLTLEGVSPGTVADREGAHDLIGWKMTMINGTPVSTLAEAEPLVKSLVKLEILFKREATVWVPVPPCAESVTSVSFSIPAMAPLNPHAKIEIVKKKSSLIYKVNGTPRQPFSTVSFSLLGDHYTRELSFPSLGTCMWLPAEDFFTLFARLKDLIESVPAVRTKGFAARFKESSLRQVKEIEEAKMEEEIKRNEKKQLKNMNAKKRKALRKKTPKQVKRKEPEATEQPIRVNQEKKAPKKRKK
eukprot:TRINITY_DN2678_c2_g2_i1.p1 TRINITY_DN2678_c2_g2~~TRINITY_DN2678_c2_g2_i1.p1  ORF type:complete len:344 (+),score=102.20 TRINITY_DN2678_c2_g2_i1:947-1978(+)